MTIECGPASSWRRRRFRGVGIAAHRRARVGADRRLLKLRRIHRDVPFELGDHQRHRLVAAQRGALDWWKKFRDATLPVFNDLYTSVATGVESQRSIDSNSKDDYREKLDGELKELRESEMWQAGRTVRGLRPENQPKAAAVATASSTKEVFSQLSAKSESVG